MFRFIHAADLHLDSPLCGLEQYDDAPVKQIRQATRRALENLVTLAIEQKVAFVLVSGDIYDGDLKDYHAVRFFVKQMDRLRAADIRVALIAGNHDAASVMTRSLRLPDNVRMLAHDAPETVPWDDVGVAIHGLSFARKAVAENVVPSFPSPISGAFNIGMLHTSLDSNGEDGHARYAPCRVGDLESKHYDYWALGHIHTRQRIPAAMPIVFPGNPQGRHVRETGAKGCMLVSVDDRMKAELQFRPLDVFRWTHVTVDAAGAASGNDVLDLVSTQLDAAWRDNDRLPMAARVSIQGRSEAHRQLAAAPEKWTEEIRSAAQRAAECDVWIEKVRFHTQPVRAFDAAANHDGPMGELAAYLMELRGDDVLLRRLGSELADLRQKLPRELVDHAEGLRIEDPAWLREVLDQVEPLLTGRLLAAEDAR
jgi:DNA repair exonuclease SbcCD nuclease subunit